MNRKDSVQLPPYYIIEPTNQCNFACSICPHSMYTTAEKGFMSWVLFETIIKQIQLDAQVIQLYFMGEPLLHPDIIDMIKLCKKRTGAKVILSSNGSLLTEEVIEPLVRSGLDELIISIDACDDQSIYGRIRAGGNLKEVNDSVVKLIKAREKMRVVVQFIDMYINRSEKAKFIAKWHEYDCSINVQCLYTWANQLPSLNDMSDNLSPIRNEVRVPCADLWKKMCVRWNGAVTLCCFDWRSQNVIGDIRSASLIDCWNSHKLDFFREKHTQGDYRMLKLCQGCDAWATDDEYEGLYSLGNT